MELAFESRQLRSICEHEAEAERELGGVVAEALKHRLADLRAAMSVQDLLAGHPRFPDPADLTQMVVDLVDGYCIIFRANHPNNPTTETGTLNWSKVSRIKVIGIQKS